MRSWLLADADWNHWPDGIADEESWPLMAAAGIAGVEVGVYAEATELSAARRRARDRLATRHGLPVLAILLSLPAERWPAGALTGEPDRLAAEAVACARECVRLGLPVLGLWPGADPAGASWSDLVAGLTRVRDAVAASGVRVAVEYKPGTAVPDAAAAARLADAVPGTGVLLDTGHAYAAGEDPAAVIRRLGDRLWHLHLGDAATGNPDDDLPLGRVHDGTDLVRALDASGFAGVATLDLYGAVAGGACTGIQAVRESVAHLRTVPA